MKNRSKRNRIIAGILAILILVVMVVTMVGSTLMTASAATSKTIPNGIYVGPVNISGMTEDEALNAVYDYVDELSKKTFTMTVEDSSISVTPSEFGLYWDDTAAVEESVRYGKSGNLIARYKAKKDLEHQDIVYDLVLKLDTEKVREYLTAHASEVNRDAVDYDLTRENGEFVVLGGINGIKLNVEDSVALVEAFFIDGWDGEEQLALAADVAEPRGSMEELLAVKDVLGQCSTDYSTSAAGRKTNVKNGCSKLNGTLVYPGEQVSVYKTVSPFTAEAGYALAGSYENGQTVETYGGGICQVSTTLYNAVIRSELQVDERYGHSMIVSYVKPSMDAAIAGTYKDFKFTNNTDYPIYIEGYADGATLMFKIWGKETRPSNRVVTFESETLSTTEATTKWEASGDPIGTITRKQGSHTGSTARLWKIVTVDGVQQSKEVFNNTSYQMSPAIYTVGTASSNPAATAAVQAAIATQDEATIKAVSSANTETALAQQAAEAAAAAQQQQQQSSSEGGSSEGGSSEGGSSEGGSSEGGSTGGESESTGE